MRLEYPISIDTDSKNPLRPFLMVKGVKSQSALARIDEDLLNEDADFVDGKSKPRLVSGEDANGVRVTNLAGIRGGRLTKKCPNCDRIRPQDDFGLEGRPDAHSGGRRDQSHCNECRGTA